MKTSLLIILLAIVIFGGLYVLRDKMQNANNQVATTTPIIIDNTDTSTNSTSTSIDTATTTNTTQSTDIVVTSPHSGDLVKSPISVTGKAKGSWYFEASAPVEVRDSTSKVIGTGHIQAQGEWMTTDFVPFTGNITFSAPATATGTIVFKNDNPSGDPSREKSYTIPVKFK